MLAVFAAACGGGDAATDGGGHDAGAADMSPDGPTDLGGDTGCSDDADSDGHRSIACGGDDCDDTDPNRYPGNHEVCDTSNHDEDCDPRTFGFRDNDADGSPDALCCNVETTGTPLCGGDCDDAAPSVHPTANETCDGVDDDCNGMVDDVSSPIYPDCDADGYGDPARAAAGCPRSVSTGDCALPAAGAGWVAAAGDCDDGAASVHRGAVEVCNGVDDDCNDITDDAAGGCACTASDPPRPCGSMVGACRPGTQSCIAGHWETACGGSYVGPTLEACNRADDDCNGAVDDGLCAPTVETSCGVACDRPCDPATCSLAPTCSARTTDFVFDAFDPRFSHSSGCPGAACGSGWCVPSAGAGCYAQYGGAIVLPSGDYNVTFYMTHEAVGTDLSIEVDVADAAGASLMSGTVAVRYGTEAAPVLRVHVPTGCSPLQFRVRFSEAGTDLRIRAMEAVLTGPVTL